MVAAKISGLGKQGDKKFQGSDASLPAGVCGCNRKSPSKIETFLPRVVMYNRSFPVGTRVRFPSPLFHSGAVVTTFGRYPPMGIA